MSEKYKLVSEKSEQWINRPHNAGDVGSHDEIVEELNKLLDERDRYIAAYFVVDKMFKEFKAKPHYEISEQGEVQKLIKQDGCVTHWETIGWIFIPQGEIELLKQRDEAIKTLDNLLNTSAVATSSEDFVCLEIMDEHYHAAYKLLDKYPDLIERED